MPVPPVPPGQFPPGPLNHGSAHHTGFSYFLLPLRIMAL
jgi:hypothetical protein